MKEYVYRNLECLIDSNTQEPLRIYIPKDEVDRYDEISRRAYEAGWNLKEVLKDVIK